MKSKAVLFRNIAVLTPNVKGGITQFDNAYVAAGGGSVLYIGSSEAAAREALLPFSNYDIYDGTGRLLMPAFANAHNHIAMTLMRNSADDLSLYDWLFKEIIPREERLTEEAAFLGTQLGLCEMIRGGVGATADMYLFANRTVEAITVSGMRGQIACEAKSTDRQTGITIAKPGELQQFISDYDGSANGRIRVSLMVHSVYLYQESLYSELAAMAQAAGCPIQVHISETAKEVQDCLAKTGKRPPAFLADAGILDGPVIAAHCVHLNAEDRQIIARPNLLAVHCPASNMKLGSGLADVPAMLKAGIKVGLGTDGAASNNRLDMYREMLLAALIAKATHLDASVLPAAEILRLAACNGFAGMGFAESGYIAAGHPADLQVVNLNHPALQPAGDYEAAMVYSGAGDYVESLMVDGNFLMYKREIQTIDEERVMAEVRSLTRLDGSEGSYPSFKPDR